MERRQRTDRGSGRRAGRTDGRLRACPERSARSSSSRPTLRSAAWRARSCATATASTSAGIASSRSPTRSSDLWQEVLGDELLVRARLSRIYWRGRFIDYPLRLADVVRKVGPVELARCASSYAARARAPPAGAREPRRSRTGSATRFGRRLFELFFKSLHREGVGRADVGDPRRVGGAADPHAVVLRASCAPRCSTTAATCTA